MYSNGDRISKMETPIQFGPDDFSKLVSKGRIVRAMPRLLTLDFGATVDGYVSDITRTVIVGKPTARQKKIYDIVRKAQWAAVSRSRPGMVCATLDGVSRSIITKAGHGKQFGHGLGHGIGLEVHEGPGVNARSQTVLRPGMVITIEPGIYYPRWGGVRIEDDVVITRTGHRVLNQSERKLLVL